MDTFKYITYSDIVPTGKRCIRVGAKLEPRNILVAQKRQPWNYPTFRYEVPPDPIYLSPYGNHYWLFDCVWVEEPITVNCWVYGGGRRWLEPKVATVEIKEGDDIEAICREVERRWK